MLIFEQFFIYLILMFFWQSLVPLKLFAYHSCVLHILLMNFLVFALFIF